MGTLEKLYSPTDNFNKKYMKQFAIGIIPDGYHGDFRKVVFLYNITTGKTVVEWKQGTMFTYGTPQAVDINEAYWLLTNHPSSNAKFISKTN